MRRLFALLAPLALLLTAGQGAAQDATPGAGGTIEGTPIVLPSGLPDTPDPSACTVAAPTIDDLLARLGATPVPGTPVPEADEATAATAAAFALPAGEPADAATVDIVIGLMLEVAACLNTGNFLTLFAFTSDVYLQQAQAEDPLTEEEVAFFRATPEPLPAEEHVTLAAVREVTILPDGRVGALIDTVFPDETTDVQTDYFFFVEEDGRWLIDGIVEDLEGQYPPEPLATPAA